MKKYIFTVLLAFILTLGIGYCQDEDMKGAVAKLPYPMFSKEITLEKQKVKIIVYSTFIEVNAEYQVKNTGEGEISETFGFPVYRNVEMEKGESAPMDLQVTAGKNEDFFIKRKIEDKGSPDENGFYKEWYLWNVDLPKGRNKTFKVQYYLKLFRDQGIPHFGYGVKQAKAYKGSIKTSAITVDMPIDCQHISFATEKKFTGDKYIYSSLPKPKISRNILEWEYDDYTPTKDLEVYFYNNGYPDWIAGDSQDGAKDDFPEDNVLDGDVETYWMSDSYRKGIGSRLQFSPVMRYRDGQTGGFTPKVKKIGVLPGNTLSLSDFFSYSQLMDAEVSVYVKPEEKEETEEEKKEPKKKEFQVDRPKNLKPAEIEEEERKKKKERKKNDVIYIECTADPVIQYFESKDALDTLAGPLQLLVTQIYPGQKYNELCVSEVLIFDRKPGETYE